MELRKVITRLNFLYHKRTTTGLSEEEQAEESRLRREYIETIKGNLRQQLDQIKIVEPAKPGRSGCCCGHDHSSCEERH
ncbi:MAG TPA: DUF896 domain-containing protein [Firmicutes bacterium]|nr:DUF896 domain-containing protein [Bacillota bacterium]